MEWFYEDLQDLLQLTPKKDVLFIIGDWNAKVGSLFWVLVLESLVGLHRPVQLHLLQGYWSNCEVSNCTFVHLSGCATVDESLNFSVALFSYW